MSSGETPAISTPSRPRYSLKPKRSGTFTTAPNAPNVAGFSPGGQVFEGYSYLTRSTSMSTSTRSRPKGLQSRPSDLGLSLTTSPPPASGRDLPTSPSSPQAPLSTMSAFPHNLDLPKRSKTIHRLPSSISTPELLSTSASIQPPRSESETERLAEAVANLPHNPKVWLPSQVALYLTHVLGLVPRPVVEDVTAYVRNSRMEGRAFLRLSEKDLERQGLNLKWRKLMIEAVRKLRRDALRGRIWGYESGSLRWPKSAQDLEREEAGDDDGLPDDGVARNSKTTSKLTLKRMRDSRKVRGMIEAFQSPTSETVPLSNNSIDAGYGRGYVRDQTQQLLSEAEEKKLSLRRPLRPRRSTADFPWLEGAMVTKPEDVEAMLAGLTEQEANNLADELGLNDLQDTEAVSRALETDQDAKLLTRPEGSGESANDVMLMPSLMRHDSADSTSVDGDSSISGLSEAENETSTTQDDEFESQSGRRPQYGVLDEDLIRAILTDDDPHPNAADQTVADDLSPAEEPTKTGLTRSHTTASIVRPSRPYRASLYTDEELAALDTNQLHTRTESSRELVAALASSANDAIGGPDFGTARLRSAEETALSIPEFACSPSQAEPEHPGTSPSSAAPADDGDEYIFTPPDAPVRKPFGSVRRTVGRKATFGSKRGKDVLSLLNSGAPQNEIFASLPGTAMLRQKSGASATAEDEEGRGGTLGRASSRKSLKGAFDSIARPSTLSRRGLERVASEAEGEALQADMEKADVEKPSVQEAEAPMERYEETSLSDEVEHGLHRGVSVEQRLSSLFKKGAQADAGDEAEIGPAPTVTQEETTPDEAEDEAQDEAQDVTSAVGTTEETAVVVEPASMDASAVDESITPGSSAVAAEEATPSPLPTTEMPAEQAADEFIAPDAPAVEAEEETVWKDPATESTVQQAADKPMTSAAQADASSDEVHAKLHTAVDITPAVEHAIPSAVDTTPSVEDDFELVTSPVPVPEAPSVGASSTETDAKLLVPLTQLEPHPSGTGSIKKRSMVLVDRRKFESLARRMTHLEAQLDALDQPATVKGSGGLKDMFSDPAELVKDEDEMLNDLLSATSIDSAGTMQPMQLEDPPEPETTKQSSGWRSLINPSSWASYLSSLNPYYSQPATTLEQAEGAEEELDLYALLGRHESEHERHLLSIGAIPAYMLGLGAGVGFVLVKEVLGGRH